MQRVQSDSPSYLKGAVSGLAPTTQKFGLSLILTGALMIIGWGGSTWNVSRTFGDAAFVVAAFLTACFTVIMRQAKLDPIHPAALVSTRVVGNLCTHLSRAAWNPTRPVAARRCCP
jgi:hypothetical protein